MNVAETWITFACEWQLNGREKISLWPLLACKLCICIRPVLANPLLFCKQAQRKKSTFIKNDAATEIINLYATLLLLKLLWSFHKHQIKSTSSSETVRQKAKTWRMGTRLMSSKMWRTESRRARLMASSGLLASTKDSKAHGYPLVLTPSEKRGSWLPQTPQASTQ